MPLSDIKTLTKKLWEEMDMGPLQDSDPEAWENILADDTDGLKNFKPKGAPGETEALRDLYRSLKIVLDGALRPSDLIEAASVVKYYLADVLASVASKNNTVAAEMRDDMQKEYMTDPNPVIAAMAKQLVAKIDKQLSPAPATPAPAPAAPKP